MKKLYLITIFLLSLFINSCKTYSVGIIENRQLLTPTSTHPLYFYLICINEKKEVQYLSNDCMDKGDTIYIIDKWKK